MRARLLALAAVVAIVAAWPSPAGGKATIVGRIKTDQPMKARFVDAQGAAGGRDRRRRDGHQGLSAKDQCLPRRHGTLRPLNGPIAS
jgi:hypothetical protein